MAHGAGMSIVQYLFVEFIGDFFYAPIWWYTRGFLGFLGVLRQRLISFERGLGLRLWVKTLGKPMYGQYDIAGKIISFFMRLAVLFVRFIAFAVYFIFTVLAACAWLIIPVIVIWQILRNFTGLLVS
ncbi:hypothetical protein HY478_02865 [Candidatus Uhrbacteria bacterium]|nr:hypothetical protein [Candidatus Uhrbacteria bacterium]